MSDLLPCPFCGGPGEDYREPSYTKVSHYIYCNGCGCQGPVHYTTEEAVTAWNRRAPDPALLSLARLGARLCRDQLSPTGGFSHAPYAVLDRMGVEEGVLIVGYPDATGPVMKDGIRKAIADILGPVRGYIMGGSEEL